MTFGYGIGQDFCKILLNLECQNIVGQVTLTPGINTSNYTIACLQFSSPAVSSKCYMNYLTDVHYKLISDFVGQLALCVINSVIQW